jgi:hypothetical protein
MAVPTRRTSDRELDRWNQQLRQSPVYLQFLESQGINPHGPIRLSRSQQSGLERALAASGSPVPGGMHIDNAGNLNQQNRLKRNIGIGAAAGAAAATGFGLAGMGPLAGLGGAGSAAGAGGATAAGASAAGAATGGGMGIGIGGALGIGSIIADVFGNILGSRSQGKAIDAQSEAAQAQADAYLRAAEIEDARLREAEDYLRGRQGLQDSRLAPYRALGDSAVRTLADYIRVPGMRPAQEPSAAAYGEGGGAPPSTSEAKALTEQFRAAHPELGVGDFRAYAAAYSPFMAERGYDVELMEHPERLDKFQIRGLNGETFITDQVLGAGGNDPRLGWIVEGATGGGGGRVPTRARATMAGSPELLARYGRQPTIRDLMARNSGFTGGRSSGAAPHIVWGS